MRRLDEAAAGAAAPAAPAGAAARLHFLDSIRALSAVYVVLHHIYIAVYHGYPTNTGPWVLAPMLYGQFGVAVFIVVSGFSLGLAPVRRGWTLTGGFRRFIRRRAWRIIPPYWAALALSVAVVALVVTPKVDYPLSLKGVLTHLFLVQNIVEGPTPNGAFWSIAVEWQLYFVFPLFLFIRRRFGAPAVVGAIVAVTAAIKVAEGHSAVADKLLHLSPQFAALFVFGMVAAAVTNRSADSGRARPERTLERRAVGWGWVAAGSAALLVGLCLGMGTERSIEAFYWLDYLIGVSVAALLAHLAGSPPGVLRRALEARPLVSVGQYSYSLYLVHAPLLLAAWLWLVEPLGLPSLAALAIMTFAVGPVILAASYGFHLGVEKPFLLHRSLRELLGARARKETDMSGSR